MKDFEEYLKEVREKTATIPDHNLIFWAAWFCEELYSLSEDIMEKHVSGSEASLIRNILDCLWDMVDGESQVTNRKLEEFMSVLQNIDEADLDVTYPKERALYELIVSLNDILQYCITGVRGFETNLTQTLICVIDTELQDEDLDILEQRGFSDPRIQQEVQAQINMLHVLSTKKPNSAARKMFR